MLGMSTRTTIASIALALAAMLSACGGGDEPADDGRATPQPVDCKETPQKCV